MSRETMVYRKGYGVVTKTRAAEIDRESKKPVNKADFLPKEVERGSWVYRDGKLVPKQKARTSDVRRAGRKRSDLASPSVMSDIGEHRNMVTGEMVSSRSRHREILREHGLVEYGNEQAPMKDKTSFTSTVKEDLKESIEMLKSGHKPEEAGPDISNDVGVDISNSVDVSSTDPQYIRG